MSKRLDSPRPVRDLVKEVMYPTTMHGTRDSVVISSAGQSPNNGIQHDDRALMRKLTYKGLNYRRRFAR